MSYALNTEPHGLALTALFYTNLQSTSSSSMKSISQTSMLFVIAAAFNTMVQANTVYTFFHDQSCQNPAPYGTASAGAIGVCR